jgi:hypothetical protein
MDKQNSLPVRKNVWITEIPKKLLQGYSNKKNYY